MKILVSYRGIPQSPGWATGDMVVKALRNLGHFVVPYAKNYKEETWVEQRDESWTGETKLQEITRHEWDLVLFMECNDDDHQYREMRDIRTRKRACWLFDTSYYPDRCEQMVRWFGFEHIFLANPITIRQYNSVGFENVTYLPYACDKDLHYRPIGDKEHDCVLVGSIRHDREILVAELDYEEIDLKLIGGVFREEYVDTLASARIVVNQNPPAGRGLLNMRWFEAPAAGAIVFGELADHQANDVFAGWQLGYDSPEGLADKCGHYLGNPVRLIVTAQNLQNHVLCYHTYRNRCETILETVFPHGI